MPSAIGLTAGAATARRTSVRYTSMWRTFSTSDARSTLSQMLTNRSLPSVSVLIASSARRCDDEELRHDPELHVGQGLVGHGKLRVVVRRCNRSLDVVQALLVDPRRVAARVGKSSLLSRPCSARAAQSPSAAASRNLPAVPLTRSRDPLDRVGGRLQVLSSTRGAGESAGRWTRCFHLPMHRQLPSRDRAAARSVGWLRHPYFSPAPP